MKRIVAIIRPDKLDAVDHVLIGSTAFLASVAHCFDARDPPGRLYRGRHSPEPRQRLRLEIVLINDALVEDTIDAIRKAASADEPWREGSGFILAMPLDDHLPAAAVSTPH